MIARLPGSPVMFAPAAPTSKRRRSHTCKSAPSPSENAPAATAQWHGAARTASSKSPGSALAKSIQVNGVSFDKITLAHLRAGDIGFQVQRHKRDFRQFWITVGGMIAARARPTHTDPYVVHAFVVVKPHPRSMVLHTIDGAADNYTGINHLRMNFGVEKFRVVPAARYVFFRANDPDMRRRIVRIADNWAAPDSRNFSYSGAVVSPFHSLRFDERARHDAQVLASQADKRGPPRRSDGKMYKMSCSEFVFNVLSTASTTQWRERHPQMQNSLGDDPQGPFGTEMAQDAKGVHPPQLEATLQRSLHWTRLGYITDNG